VDKDALKPQLVPTMISLSGVSDKAIHAQIAGSVSLIAELDFPERWFDLIDVRLNESTNLILILTFHQKLVQSLSNSDMNINLGVLETHTPSSASGLRACAPTRSGRSLSSCTPNSSAVLPAF
jgi:hypothetical protein